MLKPTDMGKLTDVAKPLKPMELAEKAKSQIEQLTKKLEHQGVDQEHAGAIAEHIATNAEGPVALDDWMKLDAARFSKETKSTLEQQGMTADKVLADHNLAEDYAGEVLEMEGMPDGGGGTEGVCGVASGHYEKRGEGGVGIDLVAADMEGAPMPIELKDTINPETRSLSDYEVKRLEPEVKCWKDKREAQVRAKQQGSLADIRPDAEANWKPEVEDWRQGIAQDEVRIQESKKGELPVQQMDELWTRDRWLKLIKEPEGRKRMTDIGVNEKYLNYDRLRSSPDLPEWRDILDRRTTVVVSGREGDVGKRLSDQAVFERRSKQVVKIEV